MAPNDPLPPASLLAHMARLQARFALALTAPLSLAACAAQADPPPDEVVVTQTASTATSTPVATHTAPATAEPVATTIPEPTGPTGSCWDQTCVPELAKAPNNAFPEPYARCPHDPEQSTAASGPSGWQFTPANTKIERESKADACCYLRNRACSCPGGMCGGGRALRINGVITTAAVRTSRDDWSLLVDRSELASLAADALAADGLAADDLTREARTTLVDYWLEQARLEHASVAAFARLSLELIMLGAPFDLIEKTQRAALDEIAHAQGCFFIANALEPGAAPSHLAPDHLAAAIAPARVPTLSQLLRDTIVDGCIGETAAALAARHAADQSPHPAIRALLETIAADEENHAALAFEIVAWISRTDATLLDEFLRGHRAERAGVSRSEAGAPPGARIGAESEDHALFRFGFISTPIARAIHIAAESQVAIPALTRLSQSFSDSRAATPRQSSLIRTDSRPELC